MKFLYTLLIIGLIVVTSAFVYLKYGDAFIASFSSGHEVQSIAYINSVALSISVADSNAERIQGLSGVSKLGELEGKLFIFDSAQKYGIWMKDMNFPIDVMWFDNDLTLIYIKENVSPSTYPTVFAPTKDARFILETNANLAQSLNIQVGDKLTLSTVLLPADVQKNLQK